MQKFRPVTGTPELVKRDWSHLLPPGTKGLRLEVQHWADTIFSRILDTNGWWVGRVDGTLGAEEVVVTYSELKTPYRGKKLGKAMYLGFILHSRMYGVRRLSGFEHSTMAMRVHSSLSKEFGFGYEPQRGRALHRRHAFDHAYLPYSYSLDPA